MNLNKRLVYYIFGFIIGCFITYFITSQKNTEFNYLPNKRVLNNIKKKEWKFDNSFVGFDTINILDKTKIIFSESIINKDSCNSYKMKKKLYNFKAINCKKIVYFKDLNTSSF
tara:strand:- start:5 stop:343 length:339 start_codon:yes stop_codon:yes gene_type:complete